MGLVLLAVATIGGALGAMVLSMAVQSRIRALGESIQWKRGRSERNGESLPRLWADRFGCAPLPELVGQIDEGGAAWIMDKTANFVLRMKDGKKLYVGNEPANGELTINSGSGRRFDRHDAYYMMLAHHSIGNRSTKLSGGMKKSQRLMWVAARLTDLDVSGYNPDRGAYETLEEMRREFGRPREG